MLINYSYYRTEVSFDGRKFHGFEHNCKSFTAKILRTLGSNLEFTISVLVAASSDKMAGLFKMAKVSLLICLINLSR